MEKEIATLDDIYVINKGKGKYFCMSVLSLSSYW